MNTDLLQKLTAAIGRGAELHFYDGREAFAVGAAAWIDGRGLLVAELAAEHQGQVHLIAGTELTDDAGDLDFYDEGRLVASVLPLDPGPRLDLARQLVADTANNADWQRF